MPASPKQRAAAAAALATIIAVPAEGIRQIAYYDPPEILTVCYGHTGADVVAKRLYSMDECSALLTADMQKAVATVERCVPGLPVPVLAAFADAVFNLGPIIACGRASSTAARMRPGRRLQPAAALGQSANAGRNGGAARPDEAPGCRARSLRHRCAVSAGVKVHAMSGNQMAFDCPRCGKVHVLPVAPAADGHQRPTWGYNGDPARPTFTPSVLARNGHHIGGDKAECWCNYEARTGRAAPFKCGVCHSFVTDGQIQFLGDCTHALAGQTVPPPDWS